ncbi:hypothetical protein IGI04_014087 [Brassica rapa subsp. trilocularis]|uniref:RNase H type-1 domain-containing protein n=1 Tax=Brassica rapa subsp. trilocularis TaxID=1813537 RepID=A0ABQ7ML77_BRACM|nr:hypothetical protein IGI04_014087 [Brassica rapa subsp. trilocularis]
MFECPIARKVWDLVPAMAIPSRAVCNSLEDLLISCSRMTNLPPTGGLGWICTNSAGSYRFQGTETKRYIASALAAEALALLAGLSKAAFSGIKDVICLSDSKSLIDIITGNKAVVAIRGILHDVGVLSDSFNSISFRFISRVCNEPADRLAKNALFQLSNSLSEIASTDEL